MFKVKKNKHLDAVEDGMPLTLVFLQENDLGIGAEVLPSQDHLLASQHGAAVRVLLLHHGKLVSRALGCRDTQRGEYRAHDKGFQGRGAEISEEK